MFLHKITVPIIVFLHSTVSPMMITFIFLVKADELAEIQEPEVNLPYEILFKIFKCLQPKDLCRCAQVSKFWSVVALDMNLWSVLHPSKWGRGDFTFGQQSSNDFNCDCEPNYNLLEYRE